VEHDTPGSEVAEMRRRRAPRPTETADEYEVSAADRAAVGPDAAAPVSALRPSVVLGLQRAAGNAAVTSLIQRSPAALEEADTDEPAEPSPVLDVVGKGRGQQLDPALKEEMDARLGADFSDVRIHTDADAARSAAAVSARAYTVGNEVVFGAESPALDSAQGKRTLAHELTHVVQQRNGPVAGTATGDGISISDPSDQFEQAAEANAARVMSDPGVDSQAPTNDAAGGPALAPAQRDVAEDAEEEQAELEHQEEPADEEPADALPVQGMWVQRASTATDTVGQGEDEETYEEEAEAEEQDTEASIEAADLEVEEDEAEGEAEDQAAEIETEQDEAQAEADNEAEEAEEQEDESVQGIWLQREPADADGGAQREDADTTPSVDQFDQLFNTDEIISDLSEAGAADLAPEESEAEAAAPTAQALFLQRDPPTAAPAAGGPSPQTSDPASAAAPTVQPGSAGKVLAALAEVPEFKAALGEVKAAAATDWKQIVAGTTPAEKVIIFTVAGSIVGGGVAGAMSNKSSRSFMLDQVNDQKIDIPGLSGLSVTPKTANGGFQGGVVTLDVYKMFPQLQKALPGLTN
jgi:hypothetical protein